MPFMRRLLRDPKTRCYVAPNGAWTVEPAQAYDFVDVVSLIDRAIKLDRELEQVLMFLDLPSSLDIVIPLERPVRAPAESVG